jgi:hypothetical protein
MCLLLMFLGIQLELINLSLTSLKPKFIRKILLSDRRGSEHAKQDDLSI